MLPEIANVDDLVSQFEETFQERTKTFYINTTNNTVGGIIDEVMALEQSIYLLLNTEADQYIIYPYTYGITTLDLYGKPDYYVMAVIPNRIKDALLTDDRITDVTDFSFESEKNKLHVSFVVKTIYGEIDEEMAVIY